MPKSPVNYVGVDKTPLVIEGHAQGQNLPTTAGDAKEIVLDSGGFLAVENTISSPVNLVIQAGTNSAFTEAGLDVPSRTIAIAGNRSTLIRLYPAYQNANNKNKIEVIGSASGLKVFGVRL